MLCHIIAALGLALGTLGCLGCQVVSNVLNERSPVLWKQFVISSPMVPLSGCDNVYAHAQMTLHVSRFPICLRRVAILRHMARAEVLDVRRERESTMRA